MNVAFFAVCNSRHFVALTTMVNSLREVGHNEAVYVTDCGLTEAQRELLQAAANVHVIEPPEGELGAHAPHVTHRLYGPRVTPDVDLAVLVDADIVLRRSMHGLYGSKPVFFANDQLDRFNPKWELLGYPKLNRKPIYVNAGLVILTPSLLAPFQAGIDRMLELAVTDTSLFATPNDPFYWVEQDVLNALLGSLDEDSYLLCGDVSYWPFKRGPTDPIALHHIQPKPWIVPRPQTVYSSEMIRLLHDGEIQPPKSEVPRRLRRGALGGVLRRWYTLRYHVQKNLRGKLGVRRRLAKSRGSRHLRTPHVRTGMAIRFRVLATLTIAGLPSAMVGARDLPLRWEQLSVIAIPGLLGAAWQVATR